MRATEDQKSPEVQFYVGPCLLHEALIYESRLGALSGQRVHVVKHQVIKFTQSFLALIRTNIEKFSVCSEGLKDVSMDSQLSEGILVDEFRSASTGPLDPCPLSSCHIAAWSP